MSARHIALLALLCLFASRPVRASTLPTPPQAILTLAQSVIDAANAHDPTKLNGLFTTDAVVIDEGAPFRWTGADAGIKWLQHVNKTLTARRATLRATASAPTEYRADREGDDAYLIQPAVVTVTSNGTAHAERGLQTYTFHKTDGTWRISSATWATEPR